MRGEAHSVSKAKLFEIRRDGSTIHPTKGDAILSIGTPLQAKNWEKALVKGVTWHAETTSKAQAYNSLHNVRGGGTGPLSGPVSAPLSSAPVSSHAPKSSKSQPLSG
eukprot:CAMPEP_0114156512 /NCGR_PEP_ID=MMETSP0043_2-20121206/26094_1 /TAXON_ID=464988 /ORGANISM="Hemiselmis andersenii, Strain CCMP644" /LENGTH=106 /DNA_ID=CAMNT_0001251951 /DNA_START=1 /DNA_END=318 /DNA_ORIENTATION=+